jgi:hypothetical protein
VAHPATGWGTTMRGRHRGHFPLRAITLSRAATLAATVCLAFSTAGLGHDGPHKEWLQSLKRPDNDRNPHRHLDPKSLYCCGEADIVRTKFKVESTGGRYPDDQWYAWLNDTWTLIPPEKILQEYAPDDGAYLFVLAGTIQCFVRPKGGI